MAVFRMNAPAGILANVAFWAVSHSVSGYVAHRLPSDRLEEDGPVLRLRRAEQEGEVYRRVFRIHRWKDRLPEAGALFPGGISKRNLLTRDWRGVDRLLVETRRAESGHWMSLVPLPLCALWNPPWGVAAMVTYGLGVNAPFIAVQRFNRGRCQRILRARAERSSGSRSVSPRGVRPPTNGSSMP